LVDSSGNLHGNGECNSLGAVAQDDGASKVNSKIRTFLDVFSEEDGGSLKLGDVDPEKLGEVFTTYCTEKSWEGRPLMNCVNLEEFFADWQRAFPYNVAPSKQRIVSCYGSEVQLQIDFCQRVDLEAAEASRGLCFDTFKVALQSLISRYWHRGLAEKAFGQYSCEKAPTR